MVISGIQVPLSGAARLVLRLRHHGEQELSSRLGFAVDMNRTELRLYAHDREKLLWALGDGPDDFDELRAALTGELHDHQNRASTRA
jgi:hypothetical protein